MLKSARLKLSAPSDQASGALQELGVSAFDAQGNFVGMEALFGQLQAASKRMTPEMYAMNTALAFGSDAARLAGVAAKDG
ncbi:phage tail tape measure protein, partial [Enterococcus faecalis]|uniref:phage tail tape measure protein n=1 Tax=Enterococcus faecalis TaxID=1351 RepID=UPI00398784F4